MPKYYYYMVGPTNTARHSFIDSGSEAAGSERPQLVESLTTRFNPLVRIVYSSLSLTSKHINSSPRTGNSGYSSGN